VLEGEPPEKENVAGETGRGDCVESGGEVSAEAGEGERIPKACLREGPPDGDSHRAGETAGKTRLPPHSPCHAAR
jgi:hypothetical protein